MTFELAPLPYAYNALEPTIDSTTMEIHFSKHHATYAKNLNTALEKYPDLFEKVWTNSSLIQFYRLKISE